LKKSESFWQTTFTPTGAFFISKNDSWLNSKWFWPSEATRALSSSGGIFILILPKSAGTTSGLWEKE